MPFELSRLRLLLIEKLRPGEQQTILLWAAGVGMLGALATLGFRELLEWLGEFLFGRSDGLVATARGLPPWLRLLVPAAGGVLAGLFLMWARRLDHDRGAVDYMEAISLGDGHIGVRGSLVRAVSSACSVASGASIGREAPMVQLAALAGSLLGGWRAMPRQKLRLLVACGAAAGICSAYNAPLAGALFVAEIVMQTFAIEVLGPLLVASAVANLTLHQFVGYGSIYRMPEFELSLGLDAAAFALLGVLAGLCAPLFLGVLEWGRRPFARLDGMPWLKLGLGGLAVGAVSLVEPAVWGNGYSVVNAILAGGWLWPALLSILFLKVLATAAATGSGAVGGVFTPTLFVGAVLGALFGIALQAAWPGASPLPAYVAAGMGAFLAASTHAPVMASLMIFEMTGNPPMIVPLLLACVLGVMVKRLFAPRSVYAHSLAQSRAEARSSRNARDLLRTDAPRVTADASLPAVEEVFVASRWQHVYVLAADGTFLGALPVHDFGPYLRGATERAVPLPLSLVRRDYPRLRLDSGIGEMLERFTHHPGERLPVLDDAGRLQGYVAKTDLMLALQEDAAGRE